MQQALLVCSVPAAKPPGPNTSGSGPLSQRQPALSRVVFEEREASETHCLASRAWEHLHSFGCRSKKVSCNYSVKTVFTV